MRVVWLAAAIGVTISATMPALAHHGCGEYDLNQPINLEGIISKIEYVTPHSHLYLDVTDVADHVMNWKIEFGTPQGIYKGAWRKTDLAVGHKVAVNGWIARDGTHKVNAYTVTLADGLRLFAGSSCAPIPSITN